MRKWWKLLVAFLCKEKDLCFHLLSKIRAYSCELDFLRKSLRVGVEISFFFKDLPAAVDYLSRMVVLLS